MSIEQFVGVLLFKGTECDYSL